MVIIIEYIKRRFRQLVGIRNLENDKKAMIKAGVNKTIVNIWRVIILILSSVCEWVCVYERESEREWMHTVGAGPKEVWHLRVFSNSLEVGLQARQEAVDVCWVPCTGLMAKSDFIHQVLEKLKVDSRHRWQWAFEDPHCAAGFASQLPRVWGPLPKA